MFVLVPCDLFLLWLVFSDAALVVLLAPRARQYYFCVADLFISGCVVVFSSMGDLDIDCQFCGDL